MNITKDQADKVIAALAYAKSRILSEFDDSCIVTAYNIMRGLAEDAEPVAICAVTPQGEVSIGWRHGYKPRHNENLYTSPQAAQTEAALSEVVRLSEDAGLYDEKRPVYDKLPDGCCHKTVITRCKDCPF